MAVWATPDDVTTYTGQTATEEQVQRAELLVEIVVDVPADENTYAKLAPRNKRLLKAAVSYQTAWMADHPDVYVNVDLDDVRQDGVDATMTHANSAILAPLAKRCIDRLTWRRTRSLNLSKPRGRRWPRDDFNYDLYDRGWRPLRGNAGGDCP